MSPAKLHGIVSFSCKGPEGSPLSIKTPNHQPLRKVVELICARPDLDYNSESLEAIVGLSSRQVARLFASELNTTPGKFVEQVRVDHAKALLAAGHSIAKTAEASGLGSSESMRRTFHQRLRISPSDYRTRFRSSLQDIETSS